MNVKAKVEGWLKATGFPYAIEPAKRHLKVRLMDRVVCHIPISGKDCERDKRHMLNTRSQIRRAARDLSAAGHTPAAIH